MYKSVKFFNLIEESFLLFKKTTKKTWIIAMIISVLSGSFMVSESVDYSVYPETSYTDTAFSEESATLPEVSIIEFGILGLFFGAIILILCIVFILGVSINSVFYYLYKSIYEILYDKEIDRAPLGLVFKVNSIVLLKIILGLILFVVPGVILSFKYAPLNYILCKYPNLSSKEVLNKTKEMSKGIKWKMFIFTISLVFIESVIILLTSPNMLISGYIWLDIVTSILTFIVSTIMIVFTALFSMNLFISVDSIKNSNTKCN
ncbi:MAG: hypothetical protein ACRCYC_12340 [Paraclostridium sp.]|uniref:hypothetical protein n=1 Tax=Paraclostridium sp. TaxID=2023273 RepID=UPI003F2E2A70